MLQISNGICIDLSCIFIMPPSSSQHQPHQQQQQQRPRQLQPPQHYHHRYLHEPSTDACSCWCCCYLVHSHLFPLATHRDYVRCGRPKAMPQQHRMERLFKQQPGPPAAAAISLPARPLPRALLRPFHLLAIGYPAPSRQRAATATATAL